MRTERPTPWGFDVWDPRLELRRAAADAQHRSDIPELMKSDDPTPDDAAQPEPKREPQLVGTGGAGTR